MLRGRLPNATRGGGRPCQRRRHDSGTLFALIVFPDDVHDSLLFHRWIQAFTATDEFFDRVMIRKEPLRAEVNGGGR